MLDFEVEKSPNEATTAVTYCPPKLSLTLVTVAIIYCTLQPISKVYMYYNM